eukprot:11774983-Alexandrium_andersonii.AAC.1
MKCQRSSAHVPQCTSLHGPLPARARAHAWFTVLCACVRAHETAAARTSFDAAALVHACLLYTSPSPRD